MELSPLIDTFIKKWNCCSLTLKRIRYKLDTQSYQEINCRLKDITKAGSRFYKDSTYKNLNCTNPILFRAYDLFIWKIHKTNYSLRVIVSSIDSSIHNLASFLHKIIHENLPLAEIAIDNNYQLTKNISKLTISHNTILLSLDVVSLFNNVPIDLILKDILRK